ncbi:MAG: trigger factor [Betaproteobacteria bacterium]|nr:trigger factor [Betaproteobacteria bacterium]
MEELGALERRVNLSVELQAVEFEVANRLKHIARTVRLDGFRHGKVPMKLVERQYGGEVRQEVLARAIEQVFSQTVEKQKLKVAGFPRIEPKAEPSAEGLFEFQALFEIYPQIEIGSLADKEIVRPQVTMGEAEVDKTLDVLAKQRVRYVVQPRPAQAGDRVTLDFVGRIDGETFPGGEGSNMTLVIGAGRALPEFENGLTGMSAGERKTVDVPFPEDYHAKELAGKTAQFELAVHEVAEPVLPAIDAEFARNLGIADGDVTALRSEILGNLEREVRQRVRSQVRDQVMQLLLDTTSFEVPKTLVQAEAARLMDQARKEMQGRGMDVAGDTLPVALMEQQAHRRVALGLILSEIVQEHQLTARSGQVMQMIEELAQSYEDPDSVIAWYRDTPEKMQEITSLALEENVVDWVLGQVRVTDQPTSFEELMGRSKA